MSMFNCIVIFLLLVHLIHGIYIPLHNATIRKLSNVGIKTLGWQSNLEHLPQVTVHHNYSRVYTHPANQPQSYGYSYNRSYTNQQSNRAPKTSSNLTQIVDQHPQIVENHQQSSIYHQGINDQLGEFTSNHQDLVQNVNENLQNQYGSPEHEGHRVSPVTVIRDLIKIVKPEIRANIHLNPQEMKFVEEEFQVHKICPPGATGQFVTELSCNQFLNCWKGRGFVQNCAPGTLFNPKTLECDFKDKVACITGPREVALNEREPLSEALQAKCPQGFSGIIPHYTDCSKFINCHNGAEFVMDCAPGTLFDIKSNMCDYPYKALCVGNENIGSGYGGAQSQSSSNKLVTIQGYKSNITYQIPAQNINDQLQEFETYANSYGGRDGKYYQVGINNHLGQFGTTNQQSPYTQWQGQIPIYIGNLSDTSKTIHSEQNQSHHKHPQPNQRERPPKCPDGQSGLFPHPTICTKFLNCDHGRTFIQDCGPGTAFNPKFKVCDYPYNVDCQNEEDLDEDGYTTENYDEYIHINRNYRMVAALNEAYSMGLNQNYCQNKAEGFFIYPKDCSRFLYCDDDGKFFIGVCRENMHFNPAKANCEEDINCLAIFNQYHGGYYRGFENWHVNTQYQDFRLVDTTIAYDTYIFGLDKTFCEINPGFSIHPRNCSRFLLCISRTQLLLGICNLNTYFNPSTRTCERTYNCTHIQHEDQSGGGGQQSGAIGQENWQTNTQYQHFRLTNIGFEANILGLNKGFCQINPGFSIHPKDCGKFLLCTSQGQIFLGICNPNTYYNPSIRTCERTYNCAHIQHGNQSGGGGQQSGVTGQENWQTNTQYEHFRLTNIGFEANTLGLNKGFCQINPGFSIHPKDCGKFLLCTSQGQIFLGICNSNTYYNPSIRTCERTYNCAHIQHGNQSGGGEQQSGVTGQDNWQINTQYQQFRLTNIGFEANTLGLNKGFCQINPGFSIHPKDCGKFLLCTSQRQILLGICNSNTYYNPSTKTCERTYNCAHIQHGNQSGGGGQQSGAIGQENWQPNIQYQHFRLTNIGFEANILGLNKGFCQINPGFSIHPKNCGKFLLCTSQGQILLGICNPNTYYNPSIRTCERTYNCAHVQQESQTGGGVQQSGSSVNENWPTRTQYQLTEIGNEAYRLALNEQYCQNNPGFSIYPGNCSKFLLCAPDRSLLLGICNANTFYNPSTRTCDSSSTCQHIQQPQIPSSDNQQWKVNQQYEDFYLREAGNEMIMLKLDMHYCLNNNGFSVHPKNCSKFLLCQNSRLMLGICKPHKYFNPSTKRCDGNYKCTHGQGGQNNFDSSSQQGPQWENQQFSLYAAKDEMSSLNLDLNYCQEHDGFSEHPANCTRFLYCKYGKLYIGHCKPNMVYNQSLKTCDYNSKCRKIRYERVQEDGVTCKSKPNGLHPHPSICSKFLNCERGLSKIHDCAAGTVFNPKLKLCDFPHNVDCKDGGGDHWEDQDDQLNQNNTDDQLNQNRNQWDDQLNQNRNQWEDQYNQNQNQDNQWNQTQDNQWSVWDQNSQWLTTQKPTNARVIDEDEDNNFVTYDQNKKPTNKWPPPFPTTDPNADYVFEANDLVEVTVPDKALKDICKDTDFRCTKTTCIEPSRVCDGSLIDTCIKLNGLACKASIRSPCFRQRYFEDCPDGEDEKNCEKFIQEFQHISSTKMAVKEKIRYDNITLTLCAKNCIESKGFICKAFNFRKLDGACFLLTTNVGLSGSLFILPTYDYYEYKKHSIDCTNKYKCTNQKCIEEHQICDGVSDCVDRYDEKGCTAQELGYSVKLVGTGKSYEGAVQVTALGKTGYVCDDMFSLAAADILCKELGFQLGAVGVKGNSYFAQNLTKNETFFIMDDIVCNGNEVSIRDCDFSGWGVSNCMEKEALGVICKTPEEICASEMWQCEGVTECIPLTFLCDGVDDCSDISDEADKFCNAPLEMRLVGGNGHTEGRVEIKHHGTWGTICDDDLNDDAAKVICAYLGYPGPARIVKEGYFGQGTGPIWLDQVFCHGNETSVEDCIRWDWGVHNCDHTEDVGVICSNYNNEGYPRHGHIEEDVPEPILPLDRCGYRNDDIFLDNSDVSFRVVASSLAGRGQYPWQASLRVKARTSTNHWCGAVVISAKFVLTAAHCLHGFTKGAYVVVAGDYDANDDEGTEQQVYIDEFYIHESFRKGTKMNNDIALIRLKGNGFNITKDVQPICLPDTDFTDDDGLNCTISGFGSVQTGKAVASKELRAGWIPIQSSEICKMPHIYGKTITDGMICAGYLEGGIDACDGDSGGPLACLHNGLFTLVGITSWGQHCGEANKPGVYVKIAHYRNWIDETMKKHA